MNWQKTEYIKMNQISKQNFIAIIIILIVLIYTLNLIDYFQTVYAIDLFGLGIEANPIAIFMFENNCASVAKLVGVPTLLAIMGFIVHKYRAMIWSIYILLAIYLGVIINNFNVLFRLGVFN